MVFINHIGDKLAAKSSLKLYRKKDMISQNMSGASVPEPKSLKSVNKKENKK
jgi:hypothetical protein